MAPQELRIATTPRAPVKRALLIALQYPTHPPEHRLQYTYEDADKLRSVLIDLFQFKSEDVTVLKDDGQGDNPTREVILDHMRRLVFGSMPGDRFVFHFSGHGGQRENMGHDTEDDGKDETIWPADVRIENDEVINDIIDDVLSDTLLPPVCLDARLVIIFDSCHSGTAADLDHWFEDHKEYRPKKYRPSRRSKPLNLSKNAQAWSPVTSTASGKGSPKDIESALASIGDDTMDSGNVVTLPEMPRIVSWAACADPQKTGGLPNLGGLFVKVFTDALRQAAKCPEGFTHGELLKTIKDLMVEAIYILLQEQSEKDYAKGKTYSLTKEQLQQFQELEKLPKPQLLGLPNLDEVKNFLIGEMF